jgi:hypothetical protein
MSLPNSSQWGASAWGNFLWGSGGQGGLGYPVNAPTTIVLLRILRPYHSPVKKKQPVDYSNAGTPYIYVKGLTEYTFEVPVRLNKSEAAALKDFYDTYANGKANEVFYIDPFGNRYGVRIMNDEFNFPEEAWNKYTGTLTLRKEE